jgi:hypothetical protein
MDITNFFPKYPNIEQSKYSNLNPYDNFYESLYRKKEFYENKLNKVESFPTEKGMLTKYQSTIARYLSSHTPYDKLLLVHAPGLGKTCSAIGAIEQVISEQENMDKPKITGAIILAKGENLLENFTNELVHKCTAGKYVPQGYDKLSDLAKVHRIRKKTRFYYMDTFAKFTKRIKKMSDADIKARFSNKFIVVDEVHNLRIQNEGKGFEDSKVDSKDEDTLEIYEQMHRFLHTVESCKILLMSGTPMKDDVSEISAVFNLLLPMEKQFPRGEEFLEEYMNENDGVYIMKPGKTEDFKGRITGLVSYLREAESSVKKEYIGEIGYGGLKHFITSPGQMSSFQSSGYLKAYASDSEGKKGVYINSREASLFVYPDKSYGKKGFEKYVLQKPYRLSKELKDALTEGVNDENDEEKDENIILENIKKYSINYYQVIKGILNTKGNCFVYSSLVGGSGAILFSLLLNLFGFSSATGKESQPGLRYALMTHKTITSKDTFRKIQKRFNKPDNKHGDYIKVIIGSKAISEGFSFYNVIFEAVNTPHWNYSETAQALARGIRLGSHRDLVNPVVKILQPIAVPRDSKDNKDGKKDNKKIKSIDLLMYKTSEDKDISIQRIIRLLAETSFDCALNYVQNYFKGVKGSRECSYTTCKFKCDKLNMDEVQTGLNSGDIDYSTYQLFYSNPPISDLRKKIEQLLTEKGYIELEATVKNLQMYPRDQIENVFNGKSFMLKSEYGVKDLRDPLDTQNDIFINTDRYSIDKIKRGLEELFKNSFIINLKYILKYFSDYTNFEVINALSMIITENISIKNKYGLPSYLREDSNMFYIVNGIIMNSTKFDVYYTEHPYISDQKNFKVILEKLFTTSIPTLIDNLCMVSDEKMFSKLVKTLPLEVQEILLESAIKKDNDVKGNDEKTPSGSDDSSRIMGYILKYYTHYIKKVGGVVISTLLKTYRCFKNGEWEDCDEKMKDKLIKKEKQREEKAIEEKKEKNVYKIVGKYNPENDAFCMVDYMVEKAKTTKSGKVDKRLAVSGKVCGAGGWKLTDLMKLAIVRLKIPAPDNFRPNDSKKTMIDLVKKDKGLVEVFKGVNIEDLGKENLRIALYWGKPKKEGGNKGIKPICEALKAWFTDNGLLEIDNTCGVQGKTKTAVEEKPKKVITVMEVKDKDYMKNVHRDISKLVLESFGLEGFHPKLENKWYVIYLKKRIIGCFSFEKDYVEFLSIDKKYRKQGTHVEAVKAVIDMLKTKYSVDPLIKVNTRDKDYSKQLRAFKSYGLNVVKTQGVYTIMSL